MKSPSTIYRLTKKQKKLQDEMHAMAEARAVIISDKMRYYAKMLDLNNEPAALEALALMEYEIKEQYTELRNETYRKIMAYRRNCPHA